MEVETLRLTWHTQTSSEQLHTISLLRRSSLTKLQRFRECADSKGFMLFAADDEQMAILFRSYGIRTTIQEFARPPETTAADAMNIGVTEQHLIDTNVMTSLACLQGCDQPTATQSGVKAGGPTGDLFFNVTAAKVLQFCENHFFAENFAVNLPVASCDPVVTLGTGRALFSVVGTTAQIVDKVIAAMQIVHTIFSAHGIRLNCAKRKTEFISCWLPKGK